MTRRLPRRWLPAALVATTVFASGLAVGRTTATTVSGDPAAPSSSRLEPGVPARQTDPSEESVEDGRSQEDAVRVAAQLAVAFDGPGMLDPDLRTVLLRRHATRAARPELEQSLGEVADRITGRLGLDPDRMSDPGFVWRLVPAGWQVRSFDPDEAVVAVWATGVVVAGGVPLAPAGWHTTEVVLRWERDAWRLAAFRSEAGPVPPAVDGPAGAGSQARLIRAFRPFRHLPDAPVAP